jgi:hypothetical protein
MQVYTAIKRDAGLAAGHAQGAFASDQRGVEVVRHRQALGRIDRSQAYDALRPDVAQEDRAVLRDVHRLRLTLVRDRRVVERLRGFGIETDDLPRANEAKEASALVHGHGARRRGHRVLAPGGVARRQHHGCFDRSTGRVRRLP